MDISGEYFIPAPRARVWAALDDPEILRAALPGCRSLVRMPGKVMRGVMEIRLGPVGTTFNGTLTRSAVDAPRACRLTLAGEGADAGIAEGSADMTLDEAPGGTRVRYVAHGDVGGQFTGIAPGMVDAAAKRAADRFFAAFAARVSEGAVARAEHAVGDAAHEVAEVARDEVEKAEVAAGRGFLGGPQAWALIVLAVVIALLIIFR